MMKAEMWTNAERMYEKHDAQKGCKRIFDEQSYDEQSYDDG